MTTVPNPKVFEVDRVLFHRGCPDGICGSWIFWRMNKDRYDAKELPIDSYTHGQHPPIVTGEIVVMVDFCFGRDIILKMASQAKEIIILDHHITAGRDMGVDESDKSKSKVDPLPDNVTFIFDSDRSGAEIAWDWVYPGIPRPWFLEVIADRDLFKWRRPYSRIVSNALFNNGYYTWENLEDIFQKSNTKSNIDKMIEDFCIIAKSDPDPHKEIASVCSKAFLTEFIDPNGKKYKVKLVECPKVLRSDVGNKLSESGCDFAALWQYDFMLDEWWVSCRASHESDIDLSLMCGLFGRGGGHAKSASFVLFGSKGERLQDHFKILEIPKSRNHDRHLLPK
jgi:uncharacterized protein